MGAYIVVCLKFYCVLDTVVLPPKVACPAIDSNQNFSRRSQRYRPKEKIIWWLLDTQFSSIIPVQYVW